MTSPATTNCDLRDCVYLKLETSNCGDPFDENNDLDENPPICNWYCKAFPLPEGIPEEILYGSNLHLKPLKDQKNNIVFKKGKRMCVHFEDGFKSIIDDYDEDEEPELTMEQMTQILKDKAMGRKPTIKGKKAEEYRKLLQPDFDKVKKYGGYIDIPYTLF